MPDILLRSMAVDAAAKNRKSLSEDETSGLVRDQVQR